MAEAGILRRTVSRAVAPYKLCSTIEPNAPANACVARSGVSNRVVLSQV